MGNSGVAAPEAHESRFVADEALGVLDVEYSIPSSGERVTVNLETTRYVGSLNPDGFLAQADQHIAQGTLAEFLVLTIRARIKSFEVGGILGQDLLNVAVLLNETPLGALVGEFGSDSDDWQEFVLDVNVRDVKFPADNGGPLVPVSNDITFEFTGTGFPVLFEVDWLTLEPRDAPGLAWRPVILVHGQSSDSSQMDAGTAWFDGLKSRDVLGHPVDVSPMGTILNNGFELIGRVNALKKRIGVERVHLVGHSKGGVDGREYVRLHSDIETLITLSAPNGGSFLATLGMAGVFGPLIVGLEMYVGRYEMSLQRMLGYNLIYVPNPVTRYVSIAGLYLLGFALNMVPFVGPNDDAVTVISAHLDYADRSTYSGFTVVEHMFIRFNTSIVDDLFRPLIAVLTAPGPRLVDRARKRPQSLAPDGSSAEPLTGLQRVMSAAGAVANGMTSSHGALIDATGPALFLMLSDQDGPLFALLRPSGARIDPSSTDPAVAYNSTQDNGSLSFAAYQINDPEPGIWTLEVPGPAAAPLDGAAYTVSAHIPLVPGTGVSLTAALDTDRYPAGSPMTITAALTEDGNAVVDATVTATVVHQSGTTVTTVVLHDDGTNGDATAADGVYTGLLTASSEAGGYTIIVIAERPDPAFRREQVLGAFVSQSATALSGSVADHGVDTDGDGLYNQLVIDVGVTVDVAGSYRVFGTLTDGADTTIEQVRAEADLEPGARTVSLAFDGAALYALRHDGAFVVDDIVLEEVATGMGLGRAAPYTTAVYAHTEFQRPPVLLTGDAADRGEHTDSLGEMPYEALVIEVEVDMLAGADVQAHAKLYAADSSFVAACRTSATLVAGISSLAFRFTAEQIFRSGQAGPYTLRLFSLWGTALSLRVPGVVATTQPYALEDFAPPTQFTVGGTVNGLVGSGLVLQDLHFRQIAPGNGAFTFPLPTETGDPYNVTIVAQPSSPLQICTVANGSGTVAHANITNIAVNCLDRPANSALDPAFAAGGMVASGLIGGAVAMSLQSDGKIVLLSTRLLTRYGTDGRLDQSFGTNGEAPLVFSGVSITGQGLAIQTDDRIVVVGSTLVGFSDDFAVARFDPNGAPDLTFGTNGKASVGFGTGTDRAWSALIQSDGAIVVAGHASLSSPLGPDNDFAVARFTPQGQIDASFGDGGKVTTNIAGRTDLAVAAALQPDGKIVLAGRVAESSGGEDIALARYRTDGQLDPDFGEGGIARLHMSVSSFGDQVAAVMIHQDDTILIAGSATAPSAATSGASSAFALARFKSDGQPDENFGDSGVVKTLFTALDDIGRALALDADGRIVVVGQSSNRLNSNFAVARYQPDGTPDSSFGDGGKVMVDFFGSFDNATCVAIQPDGKILAGGSARNVTTTVLGLVRLV